MKLAIVVPHIFMHSEIYPDAIFAPGSLAISLCEELSRQGIDVTFFSPKFKINGIKNINADLSLFEEELALRCDTYMQLMQKHPLVFATLARQVQAELISKAYKMANEGEFDLVHIYTNEEELALVFAELCEKPVVFTHHEPFNFLIKYRSIFPKYKNLNWISISKSQQNSLPDANFIANIYHGIDKNRFQNSVGAGLDPALMKKENHYFAYFGRIIEPKGVHLAIATAKKAGVKLKIAGKHYSGESKDSYWKDKIESEIDGKQIEYVGFINTDAQKQEFLGKAKALLVPSIWDEPFGMVMIEAMACGTPIIGLESGSILELVQDGVNGFLVKKFKIKNEKLKIAVQNSKLSKSITDIPVSTKENTEISSVLILDEEKIVEEFALKIKETVKIDRSKVRKIFEEKFTLKRMAKEHIEVYKKLINN